jgi:ABC-2 type transport system permease protein
MKCIVAVAKREFKYIFFNRRLLFVILFVPIFYTFLFGYLYSEHTVKGIKTAVIDYNKTQLSRSVIDAFNKTDRFRLVTTLQHEDQLPPLIEKGTVDAAIVIPKDFDKSILRGEEAPVLIVVNGSNMIISNSVTTNALQIIQSLSSGIAARKAQAGGLSFDQALNQINPVSFRIRTWYNPTYNYTNFLLLGLIATAIQQITLLYVSVAVAREKETGTLKELQVFPGSSLSKVIGKTAPYLLINALTLLFSLAIARFIFAIPFRGELLAVLVLCIVFLISIVSLGIFLSLICRNELEATQIAMLIAVPSFLFSGYTWPLQAMPLPCQWLAKILPLTYFAPAIRKIAIMGMDIKGIAHELGVLALMGAILFPLAVAVYKVKYGRPLACEEASVKSIRKEARV